MEKYGLLLVDDHQILLDGTRNLLEGHALYEVRDMATTGKLALDLLRRNNYDFMVVDYSLPDTTGLDLVKEGRKLQPDMKVLVLSMHDDPAVVRELIREGISGYLLKSDPYGNLVVALDKAREGKRYFSDGIAEIMARQIEEPSRASLLTPREREILQLVAQEYSTKEIADRLCLSENTVETHRKNMLRKTECKNWPGLIAWAYKHQILS